ncbi:uncharacterized protein [Henckelia pumila]|uniref:uncharacterized protein n=1 Tax=Henckelia pumila TaxID=405737 RepID=UPI003C6E73BF
MPGLDRHLVEHSLPIKGDFKPYKQPSRRMSKEVEAKVKDEIGKLLKAGFIRPIRYAEWLSNVVPVIKKNGKLRVCIDFRDLNRATPKDVYLMPITDMLIDSVANNELLFFMDGYSGYNQIKIDERDTSKTAFRCPGAIGTFEWLVMPFGLKNAGATYQRAMNAIFHDMINHFIEVYINDIVVKSRKAEDHVEHLRKSFERMRKHNLKLNPMKCAFGVKVGNFLGFLVHQRGVEVDQNKSNAILETRPPKSKKKLHRLLGQGQAIAYFLAHHPASDESIPEEVEIYEISTQGPHKIPVYGIEKPAWTLKFDGSSPEGTASAGIVIISPTGVKTALSFNLDFPCTNNQSEYEALVIGLEVLKDLQAKNVQVIGENQGTMFVGSKVKDFAADYGIKIHCSSPYYPQANGQAEASNKVLIQILQKMMEDNPRDWPRLLSETLWAYRTSKRTATEVSPFALAYGHEAVLPTEIMVPSLRIAMQNHLISETYSEDMITELEDLNDTRMQALNSLMLQKEKVARSYNKRVRKKSFHEGDLVWKVILPVGVKDRELGKWSPNWEGPFKVHRVLDENAYWLASVEGEPHKRCINDRYLKQYVPSMREEHAL